MNTTITRVVVGALALAAGVAAHAQDKTIGELTAAIERDPGRAREAYVKRGEAYRQQGDLLWEAWVKRGGAGERGVKEAADAQYDKAIADFTAALRLAPEDAAVRFKRALAYFGKEDYHQGLADYSEAVGRDPKLAYACRPAFPEYPEDGSPLYPYYLQAIADSSAAIRRDPKNSDAYMDRAGVYRNMGEYDRALADYSQALRLEPQHAHAGYRYAQRAFCHENMGQYDKAITDYTEVIRIAERTGDRNLNLYAERGNVYARRKDYPRAIADYTEAIRLDPKSAAAHNDLARLRATCPEEKVRDGTNAVEHARTACELTDWKAADYLDTLAAAYAEVGKFGEAVKWQKTALESAHNSLYEVAEGRSRLALYQEGKPFRDE